MTRTVLLLTLLAIAACADGSGIPVPTKDSTPGDATSGAGGSEPSSGLYRDGERLEMRTLVGSDGSRLSGPVWDSALARHCEPALIKGPEDVDGTWRCAPMHVARPCIYTDHLCTKPAYFAKGNSQPGYVRLPACHADGVTTVHAVGGPASQLWESYAPNDCQPQTKPGHVQVYALGDDMAGTLVELEVE